MSAPTYAQLKATTQDWKDNPLSRYVSLDKFAEYLDQYLDFMTSEGAIDPLSFQQFLQNVDAAAASAAAAESSLEGAGTAASNAAQHAIEAAQALADAILAKQQAIQAAANVRDGKSLGSWDPSTNMPALTSDASAIEDSGFYDVIVGGTLPNGSAFAGVNFGTNQVWKVADKIKKQGNLWYRVAFTVGEQSINTPQLALESVTTDILSKNIKAIKDWQATNYNQAAQVYYDGKIWESTANTLATDIPGLSTKWTSILSNLEYTVLLQNILYKWGILSSNNRLLLGIDKNDNLDANGISSRLAAAMGPVLAPILSPLISPIVQPLVEAAIKINIGYTERLSSKYKWGALGSNGGVLVAVDMEDNLDAKALSARLMEAISTKLSEAIKSSILTDVGYTVVENDKYIWGVLTPSGKVGIALTKDLKIVGNLEGLTTLNATVASLTDQLSDQNLLEIELWGDSLTAGAGGAGTTHPNVLQGLIGPKYVTVNCGVGGENVPTIAARIGAVPAQFTEGFTIPADTATEVEVSSMANIRLKNYKYSKDIKLLLQGHGQSVNPCYVEDVECTLRWTGSSVSDPAGKWMLKRNAAGAERVVKAGTLLHTYGSKRRRKARIHIYWMGQNGGYDTDVQLIEYIRACAEFHGQGNYVVLGLHTGTPAQRTALEDLCMKEFGLRYINLRKYMSTYALADLSLVPTQEDLTAMAEGTFPPSLWATTTDKIHGNSFFYRAVGTQVYKRLQLLGHF